MLSLIAYHPSFRPSQTRIGLIDPACISSPHGRSSRKVCSKRDAGLDSIRPAARDDSFCQQLGVEIYGPSWARQRATEGYNFPPGFG